MQSIQIEHVDPYDGSYGDPTAGPSSFPIPIHHLSSASSIQLDESDDDQSIAFVVDLDTFRRMPSWLVHGILRDRCIYVKGDHSAHTDWEWSEECLDLILPSHTRTRAQCAFLPYLNF